MWRPKLSRTNNRQFFNTAIDIDECYINKLKAVNLDLSTDNIFTKVCSENKRLDAQVTLQQRIQKKAFERGLRKGDFTKLPKVATVTTQVKKQKLVNPSITESGQPNDFITVTPSTVVTRKRRSLDSTSTETATASIPIRRPRMDLFGEYEA